MNMHSYGPDSRQPASAIPDSRLRLYGVLRSCARLCNDGIVLVVESDDSLGKRVGKEEATCMPE
jgi:hypothetical protein